MLHTEFLSLRGPSERSCLKICNRRDRYVRVRSIGRCAETQKFAGLFGAAPSIALATLGLTIAANGKMYAATEARSMIAGALVFFFYAWLSSWLMLRGKLKAMPVTLSALGFWLACSISIWFLVLR